MFMTPQASAFARLLNVMRLLAVGYSLGTLILIALTARRVAGDAAGLIAAGIWAFSTGIIENSLIAQADRLPLPLASAYRRRAQELELEAYLLHHAAA